MKQISKLLRIDYRSDPAALNFTQYLGIFQFYLDHILKNKAVIRGAEGRLRRQQADMMKIHRTRKKGKSG